MRVVKLRTPESRGPSGLSARRLTRSFGGRLVLSAASVDVQPGTLAVLEGQNGAGKTTMLRVFATVVRPDAGEVTVDGYDVVRSGARVRERIGVAFVNERSVYWRLSGRENLLLFARMRGMSSRAAGAQVDALLQELDLAQISHQWAADLSAGQRQRLIVARAALGEPTCMLIDEPLRGLDETGTATMLSFLRAQASRGAAVLVVAPKLDELMTHADALYRLRDGAVHPCTVEELDGFAPRLAPQ